MTALAGARVVFRVDASLQIGTGHVMRCLTLALALREQGARCQFVCRSHPGHMLAAIARHGFAVAELPMMASATGSSPGARLAHAQWLGSDWRSDAEATLQTFRGQPPAWLVVDHYALDAAWEGLVSAGVRRLLVIDDLADRDHRCDLLLDQNLGRQASGYENHVPASCRLLIGPTNALLRPGFAALREDTLRRRAKRGLRRLLIAMGGVDVPNATGAALRALRSCALDRETQLTVVLGPWTPALDAVRMQATQMPWPTEVQVDVQDMARLMADCDLAIGAAGVSAWERCCLGLPSLLVVLADNQSMGARALADAGAAVLLGGPDAIESALAGAMAHAVDLNVRAEMTRAASQMTDGHGCARVVAEMAAGDV